MTLWILVLLLLVLLLLLLAGGLSDTDADLNRISGRVVAEDTDLVVEGDDDAIAPKEMTFDALSVEKTDHDVGKETEGQKVKVVLSSELEVSWGHCHGPVGRQLGRWKLLWKHEGHEKVVGALELVEDAKLLEEREERLDHVGVVTEKDLRDVARKELSLFHPLVAEGDETRHHL